MTYPPNVRTAPVPAPTHAPAPSAPPPAPPPAPRGAWAEGRERVRAAATTEPGRLQIIGALLALLVVVFGAVTSFEVADRYSAADDVVERSQPLSAVAAQIYGSLASADTAASSGFLAGAQEPELVQKGYRDDITTASELLVDAASSTDSSSDSGRQIATINEKLPRYTGLVERARANNRQGLPLGGAYLRYANQLMTQEILPHGPRSCTRRRRPGSTRTTRTPGCGRSWASPPVSSRWVSSRGRSAATTCGRTGCSTTVCWRRRQPPRWCCCGWRWATRWRASS